VRRPSLDEAGQRAEAADSSLGVAELLLGELDDAEADLQHAATLGPVHGTRVPVAKGFIELGDMAGLSGEARRAALLFGTAAALPSLPPIHATLGSVAGSITSSTASALRRGRSEEPPLARADRRRSGASC